MQTVVRKMNKRIAMNMNIALNIVHLVVYLIAPPQMRHIFITQNIFFDNNLTRTIRTLFSFNFLNKLNNKDSFYKNQKILLKLCSVLMVGSWIMLSIHRKQTLLSDNPKHSICDLYSEIITEYKTNTR